MNEIGIPAHLNFDKELELKNPVTEVAVIRPPGNFTATDIKSFEKLLANQGLLPLVLPCRPGGTPPGPDNWWPTDKFRQVGEIIFDNSLENISQAIIRQGRSLLRRPANTREKPVKIIEVSPNFRGGDYIYSVQDKIFCYNRSIFKNAPVEMLELDQQALGELRQRSWKILPIDCTGDLDWNLAIFYGKDNLPHFLMADNLLASLTAQLSPKINLNSAQIHSVPTAEVKQGGCNVADCRNGKLLILPNKINAPTVNQVIRSQAHPKIQLLETPPNFFDRVSGPRCAISAITLN